MTLTSPFQLKHLTLRNRIVMPGMDTNFGDEQGNIGEDTYRYYERRARGGAGLIIVEGAYFDKRGAGTQNMLALDSRKRIPQFTRLTEMIKRHGARTLLQVYHAGAQATSFMAGMKPVGPSAVPFQMSGETPRRLGKLEIRAIVWGYARACNRAMHAGFDGVEIHAGHGYLMNQFFSPRTNKRRDEYGGGFDDRIRLHMEVLNAVRSNCRSDFIIAFRLNGRDYIDGGIEIEETCRLAQILEQGGLDLLNVTGGVFDSPGFPVVPYMNYPRGVFADAAGRIRQSLSGRTPVCVVGRINTPESAEKILNEGKADLIALGRALIADPDFPGKVAEGRADQIRPCIGCNACLDRIMTEQPVACTVNAGLLDENASATPPQQQRRVLVAGAGPAGLEAARTAAQRGHHVTLIEAGERIGGALHAASSAPMKQEIRQLVPYYERLLQELPIDLRLSTRLTAALVKDLHPDTLILATGSGFEVSGIQGVESCAHSTYAELLSGTIPAGKRICVLGGGMIGLDVADLLAGMRKQVTIVEAGKRLAADLYALVGREMEAVVARSEHIRIYLQTTVSRIHDQVLYGERDGTSLEIPFDHLVLASGRIAAPNPLDGAERQVEQVIRIGDCGQPGLIFNAIHGGYQTALAIGCPRVETQSEAEATRDDRNLKSRIAGKIRSGTFALEDIPEYLELLVAACNANPKIQKKSRRAVLGFQFRIEGASDYWIRINHGTFSAGKGELDRTDVTIRMDRRIAPGIFSGRVNAASAYMAKELAFIGPMKHGIAFRGWVNLVKQQLGLQG